MKFLYSTLIGIVVLALHGCGGGDELQFLNDDTTLGPGPGATDSTQVGFGSGGSFEAGVANAELVSAGESSATWTVSVVVADQNNLAVTSETSVTFSSSCVVAGLANLDNTQVTTVAGRASVTYSSGSCTGTDTVVASIAGGASASVDLDIDATVTEQSGPGPVVDDVVRIGTGSGADFEEGVLSAVPQTLNAGGSTNITATIVDEDGVAFAQPITVNFSSPCVSAGLASFGSSSVASVAGQAVATYTASGCSGDDIVTATVTSNGEDISATVTINVQTDTVSGIEFVSSDPTALALPGSGGVEIATVTFRVVGRLGQPIPGELVMFDLTSTVGGVSIIGDPQNPDTPSATSDAQGLVSAVVQSGTVSTTVAVIATHVSTGNQTTSDSIVISSGVAVDSRFSLSQSSFIPADAFNTDGVEVTFAIIASDVFGNNVRDGSQVFFASPESGNIDSSCEIIDGACSVTWRSAGARPIDNRATIIAYTDGAEDFVDLNGNFVFEDSVEGGLGNFSDIETEPFVDENDSGEYELGEFFVDADSNGEFRAEGNNQWDGPCLLLSQDESESDRETRCPGEDTVLIFDTALLRFPTNTPRLIDFFVSGVSASIDQTVVIPSGGSVTIAALVGDDNQNIDPDIAPANPLPPGTTLEWSVSAGAAGVMLAGNSTVTVIDESAAGLSNVVVTIVDTLPDTNTTAVLELTITVPGRDEVIIPVSVIAGNEPTP